MTKRVLDEKTMRTLEARIPKLASGAFAQAYANALTVSGKVLVARKGQLVETHADGSERVIRQLAAPTQVTVGTRRVRKVKA
ncbi:hypothetical protein [Chitinilyticum litopenaei]|uniref:hypothetical protein n=1 Tax=Chitinilyticum litopenaei TaxID=1121276 RepID=UPI00041906E0|nr:hypothetical protein [Chitinilyticum litopenaei]